MSSLPSPPKHLILSNCNIFVTLMKETFPFLWLLARLNISLFIYWSSGFFLLLPVSPVYTIKNFILPVPYIFLPGKFHGQRSLVGYKSMGSQRVRHDWVTSLSLSIDLWEFFQYSWYLLCFSYIVKIFLPLSGLCFLNCLKIFH